MSVNAPRGQIFSALKELRLLWHSTREQWSDAVAREFEERVWNPLEAASVTAVGALDRLEQVMIQMRQECGGSGTRNYDEDSAQ